MEALNDVPFEVYLILETAFLLVLAVGAVVSRWILPRSKLANCLFGAALGSLVGFLIVTLPWISLAMRTQKSWPVLEIWPYWGDYSGPFTASVLGNIIGLVLGFFYLHDRTNIKRCDKTHSSAAAN